jgi:hypothetical protein
VLGEPSTGHRPAGVVDAAEQHDRRAGRDAGALLRQALDRPRRSGRSSPSWLMSRSKSCHSLAREDTCRREVPSERLPYSLTATSRRANGTVEERTATRAGPRLRARRERSWRPAVSSPHDARPRQLDTRPTRRPVARDRRLRSAG